MHNFKLSKGGQKTSYSILTDGEKLRLKIAVALAMIRVGQVKGVGRYPGLILIDSPGANESSIDDLTNILKEMESISKEFDYLQIFTTSAKAKLVKKILPEERIISVPKGQDLW